MTELDLILRRCPNAVVAAMGSDGRPVPVPDSVPLCDHHVFEGRSGLGLLAAKDQMAAIAAWERSFEEPMVCLDVHMAVDPDQTMTIYFLDMRAEYGVHLLVADADDPEALLASAASHASLAHRVAHVTKDAVSIILGVDDATTSLLGWRADDLVGHRTMEFVHPDDVQRAIDSWMEMRKAAGTGRVRLRYRHAHGHYVWVEITNHNQLDDPDVGCVTSEMVDISDEMARLEALRDRERLLGRLAEALPIGVCHLRLDGEVVYSNEPLLALLGPVDSVEALMAGVAADDRQPVELALEQALQGHPSHLEVSVTHGRGGRRCE